MENLTNNCKYLHDHFFWLLVVFRISACWLQIVARGDSLVRTDTNKSYGQFKGFNDWIQKKLCETILLEKKTLCIFGIFCLDLKYIYFFSLIFSLIKPL